MEKINFVIKKSKYLVFNDNIDISQAFIVVSNRQMDTAIKWGTEYKNWRPETGENEAIAPIIKETDNCGFKLTLFGAAESSSCGGKLSFWNCIIEKSSDDIRVLVGIPSESLLDLMKNTTFVNGVCQSTLKFCRYNGRLAVLPDSDIDNDLSKKINAIDSSKEAFKTKKKTKKWMPGRVYETLQTKSVYLGDVYKLLDANCTTIYTRNVQEKIVEVEDTGNKCLHIVIDYYKIENVKHKYDITGNVKMSDIKKYWVNQILDEGQNFINTFRSGRDHDLYAELVSRLNWVCFGNLFGNSCIESFPARVLNESEYVIMDVPFEEVLCTINDTIVSILKKCEPSDETKKRRADINLSCLIFNSVPYNGKNALTESNKFIIDSMLNVCDNDELKCKISDVVSRYE